MWIVQTCLERIWKCVMTIFAFLNTSFEHFREMMLHLSFDNARGLIREHDRHLVQFEVFTQNVFT